MLLGRFLFVYITNINYLLNSVVSFLPITRISELSLIVISICTFTSEVRSNVLISVGESMMGEIGGEVWGGVNGSSDLGPGIRVRVELQ